jgi:hypothetical protein
MFQGSIDPLSRAASILRPWRDCISSGHFTPVLGHTRTMTRPMPRPVTPARVRNVCGRPVVNCHTGQRANLPAAAEAELLRRDALRAKPRSITHRIPLARRGAGTPAASPTRMRPRASARTSARAPTCAHARALLPRAVLCSFHRRRRCAAAVATNTSASLPEAVTAAKRARQTRAEKPTGMRHPAWRAVRADIPAGGRQAAPRRGTVSPSRLGGKPAGISTEGRRRTPSRSPGRRPPRPPAVAGPRLLA